MELRTAQLKNRFKIEKLEERIAPSGLEGTQNTQEADGHNGNGSFNDTTGTQNGDGSFDG